MEGLIKYDRKVEFYWSKRETHKNRIKTSRLNGCYEYRTKCKWSVLSEVNTTLLLKTRTEGIGAQWNLILFEEMEKDSCPEDRITHALSQLKSDLVSSVLDKFTFVLTLAIWLLDVMQLCLYSPYQFRRHYWIITGVQMANKTDQIHMNHLLKSNLWFFRRISEVRMLNWWNNCWPSIAS